ncbi:hypothetical protein [Photobacterium sp. OFAV2-7]|uniref:hypothetical protein n=1 Tax=Photobacterium sp. OFAV2-7 TaxID=2917748 RepID=UPI001EF70888|nr:hypothetical protein [Photobacterium sp. OFAV2-7]MCG7588635.1 hypothetical protein [Photobacterium sp. OFAV2-7]
MFLSNVRKLKIVQAPKWVNGFIFIPSTLSMLFLAFLGEPYIYESMSDPILYLDGEIWTGFGSNMGILMWACSAAIALFCGTVMLSTATKKQEPYLLILLGSLTLLLSLDDLFLLHDAILPYFSIKEHVIFAIYAFLSLFIIFKHLNVISQTENFLLFIGGTLLFISICIDILPKPPFLGFIEDAAKFIGICAWSGYLMRTSFLMLIEVIHQTKEK